MTLPSIGEAGWGAILNAQIQADELVLGQLNTAFQAHALNEPADPHGDRGFASTLFDQITTGTNEADGFVVLNNAGKIPYQLLLGGGITNLADIVGDYDAPTNGSDASTQINQAIADMSAAGGGMVWAPGFTYGLAGPIVMQSGVVLWMAPGAAFNRINLTGIPQAMVVNYSGSNLYAGPFEIWGGAWNVSSIAASGSMFAFADASNICVKNTQVAGYPDGQSPVGQIYGCTSVLLDNIEITGAAPSQPRGSNTAPVFLVELNATGLAPGENSLFQTSQPCTNIIVRDCGLLATTATDSVGVYSGWHNFVGNYSINQQSGVKHTKVVVRDNKATGLSATGINLYNWDQVEQSGNKWNYPPAPYTLGWVGSVPAQYTWQVEGNVPESFPGTLTSYPSNVTTEQKIVQFAIPANDWIPGSTFYDAAVTGYLSSPTNSGLLTQFTIYAGSTGTTSDTKLGQVQYEWNGQVYNNLPWGFNIPLIGIDSSSQWWMSRFTWETNATSNALGQSGTGGGLYSFYTGGSPVAQMSSKIMYLTITAKYSQASASNVLVPTTGVINRIKT